MKVTSIHIHILICIFGMLPIACDDMYEEAGALLDPENFKPTRYTEDSLSRTNRLGGTGSDSARSVAVCPDHGFVIAGCVTGDADLNGDQAVGSAPESAAGVFGGTDIIISKFNISNKHRWSRRLGGSGADQAFGVAVDSAGSIYFTGTVNNAADLNGDGTIDPSPSRESPVAGINGDDDIIVIKFSSTGQFIWARRLGGVNDDTGYAVAVDTQNNVVVCGSVYGVADLDGNGIIDAALPENSTSTIYAGYDIFFSKFDSDGNPLLSKRLGGPNSEGAKGIATDSNGTVIVAGYVTGNADFDNDGAYTQNGETPYSVNGNIDAFITAFDNAGTYDWSKRLGGTGNDEINSVAVGSAGDVIVAGTVYQNADLDGDGVVVETPEIQSGSNGNDGFVSIFYADDGSCMPLRLGGSANDSATALAITQSDAIVVAGTFYGNVDLNNTHIGDLTCEMANAEEYALFDVAYSTFDASGVSLNIANRLGGINNDYCYGIAADNYDSAFISRSDNIIITGSTNGNANLDGIGTTSGEYPDSPGAPYGSDDIFVSRIYTHGTVTRLLFMK